jgi:3-hydroxyacyl-[acyl-carrier-protein] dehydratase
MNEHVTARDEAEVARTLPHHPPFRLVDRLLSADGERAVATRLVTRGDPLLPELGDALPAVLVLEAMAQTAALLAGQSVGAHRGYLVAVRDLRCESQARAGDLLELTARREASLGALQRVHAEARVGDRLVARGELTFAVEPA